MWTYFSDSRLFRDWLRDISCCWLWTAWLGNASSKSLTTILFRMNFETYNRMICSIIIFHLVPLLTMYLKQLSHIMFFIREKITCILTFLHKTNQWSSLPPLALYFLQHINTWLLEHPEHMVMMLKHQAVHSDTSKVLLLGFLFENDVHYITTETIINVFNFWQSINAIHDIKLNIQK